MLEPVPRAALLIVTTMHRINQYLHRLPPPRRYRRGRASYLAIACLGALMVWLPAARATPPPDQDTDGDLIPDQWELAHGLNPNDASDADLDPDGDRLTNRDEFYAGTDPMVSTDVDALSDWQVLGLFEGKAFLYFWEQSHAPYYFTADNANYDDRLNFSDNFNSIAGTGFSLVAYVVADDRGWIGHQAAYQRIHTVLARAVALQDPSYDRVGAAPTQEGNRHGYLYHFVDNQGLRHPGAEISTIDHALFVAGALVAAEYYKGTDVEQLARQLYLNTQWNWLFNGQFLYQGWIEDASGTFEGGRPLDQWNRYSELLVLLFLAMGHPNTNVAIPASAWDALAFGTSRMFPNEYVSLVPGDAAQNFAFVPNLPNTVEQTGYTNSSTALHYIHAGSLHNHQYSHLVADFRARRDRYGTDFFANSISATMASRQFCINLNTHAFGGDPTSPDPYLRQPYETYGPTNWGLMAGLASSGYQVLQPIVAAYDDFSPANIAANNDSGTVVLSAALGSSSFTPRQAIDFARDKLSRFQARQPGYDALIGRYGFRNAFNLGRTFTGQLGHFPSATIGLDLGAVIGSIENLRSGLVWKFAMRQEFFQRGMEAAGFSTGVVEPFIVNFDDNPPAPQEDPNGGGQDPNSFGGSSYGFGTGTIAYEFIGDPFPQINFGPQQWVQRITTTNSDSGGFMLLRNHSVSRWDRLSFWIRGAVGDEQYSVGLKDRVIDRLGSSLQAVEVKLPIATYHPAGGITSQWTEVRIPLRDFADRGVRLTELDNISFTSTSSSGGTMYVDDIAFLGDEFAPQAPQGLAAAVNIDAVTLTWNANSEPDVVGYRVYRSDDGGATFPLRTPQIVVDTTFTETGVSHGTHQYRITAVDNAQPQNESTPSASISTIINRPPQWQSMADQSIAEGQALTLTVSATDPDGDLLTLTARLANGDPLTSIGANFTDMDNGAGRLTWTPTFAQAGTYLVTFTATDTSSLSATQTVTITVVEATPPPPTVVISSPAIGAAVDRTTGFVMSGTSTAAPGTIVTSVIVKAWDLSNGQATFLGNQPITVTNLNTQTASWTSSIPGNLVPDGHTLRLRAVSTSQPASTATGRSGLLISPSGLVQVDNTCYVLTAAYGTPDATAILLLREFRERCIPKTWWHLRFLAWYDRHGPSLARIVKATPILQLLIRSLITPAASMARWWFSCQGLPTPG